MIIYRQRIIEYRLDSSRIGPLAALSVEKFILRVAARSSAPGGGSVAALLASLVNILLFIHTFFGISFNSFLEFYHCLVIT